MGSGQQIEYYVPADCIGCQYVATGFGYSFYAVDRNDRQYPDELSVAITVPAQSSPDQFNRFRQIPLLEGGTVSESTGFLL